MPFMDLALRRRPRRWVDHLIILGTTAASLAAGRLTDDELTGRGQIADVAGFTALFVGLGYFLARLPTIWARTRRTALEVWVTPGFVGLTLAYFYLGFRSYFIQPGATGPMLLLQLLALVGLACRGAAAGG